MSEEYVRLTVPVEHRRTPLTILRHNVEEDDGVQANLFDEDYTVAAATGFTIWPGSQVMLDFLTAKCSHNTASSAAQRNTNAHAASQQQQQQLQQQLQRVVGKNLVGKRVVELGSGIGLLGLALAAHGAHVLMTDVRPVVEDILQLNIDNNNTSTTAEQDAAVDKGEEEEEEEREEKEEEEEEEVSGPWPKAKCICDSTRGTASCMPLNWVKDTQQQCSALEAWNTDMIIAAETIWLKELVDPFVNTICTLLDLANSHRAASKRAIEREEKEREEKEEKEREEEREGREGREGKEEKKEVVCLLAYTNRGNKGSETFAVTQEVLDAFRARGCTVTPVHTELVERKEKKVGDGEEEKGEEGREEEKGEEGKPCTVYSIVK